MESKLKVGVGLDRCLTDTEGAFVSWKCHVGINADTFMDSKMIRDESFWRSLKPYPDVVKAGEIVHDNPCVELYVLTERPPALLGVTRNWLRLAGIVVADDHIIFQTIKRYDARLLGLSVLCDTDKEALEEFVYDETHPVWIPRPGILRGIIMPENKRIHYEWSLDKGMEYAIRLNDML